MMTTEPIHILSLGAGVQSSTLALMAAAGEITPMPKAAIFADTQAEPKSVYTWLDWLEKQLPFPIHRVTKGNLLTDTLSVRPAGKFLRIDIPAFVVSNGKVDGFITRSCTRDYKLNPIFREQRQIIGKERMLVWRKHHKDALKLLSKYQLDLTLWKRNKKAAKKLHQTFSEPFPIRPNLAWESCQQDALVVSWIGISKDEILRVKESSIPWSRNMWPLIDAKMNRHDCLLWMAKNNFPKPTKSACIFCPYHSDNEWRSLSSDEFKTCVDLDRRLRLPHNGKSVRTVGELYLHKSGRPLSEVDFTHSGQKQPDLFNNECEGMCGV